MFIFLILGIVQGIFEWLPISSEGVVALFSQWLIADFNLEKSFAFQGLKAFKIFNNYNYYFCEYWIFTL